jgi:hypothetical protein
MARLLKMHDRGMISEEDLPLFVELQHGNNKEVLRKAEAMSDLLMQGTTTLTREMVVQLVYTVSSSLTVMKAS